MHLKGKIENDVGAVDIRLGELFEGDRVAFTRHRAAAGYFSHAQQIAQRYACLGDGAILSVQLVVGIALGIGDHRDGFITWHMHCWAFAPCVHTDALWLICLVHAIPPFDDRSTHTPSMFYRTGDQPHRSNHSRYHTTQLTHLMSNTRPYSDGKDLDLEETRSSVANYASSVSSAVCWG